MADPAGPKPNEIDADKLARLLELELIQKRATWKQAGERYRSIRTAGFVFLFVLIVGCVIGGLFFFLFGEVKTGKSGGSPVVCLGSSFSLPVLRFALFRLRPCV